MTAKSALVGPGGVQRQLMCTSVSIILLFAMVMSGCTGAEIETKTETENPEAAPDPAQIDILLGSSAKRLCSSVFVSGRSRAHVFAHELNNPALAAADFTIDPDSGVVAARLLDRSAVVLHRPGIGCTLALDTDVASLRQQFDPGLYPDLNADEGIWPGGSEVVLPESLEGIDLPGVRRAVEDSFNDIEVGQNISTRAALVVFRGQIVAEQYGQGFTAQMPQLGWSMTKTVTNALTGLLVEEGKLAVDAPAPVAEWRSVSDPRREITLGNLLQMSSGLEFSEVYTAGSMSDVISMLYATGDTAGFTAAKPLQAPPDTKWYYSSGTTNIISRILRNQFTSQQEYFNFPRERLFKPLGMASAVIEPDASGTFVGSSYMYATPRDWAKIGLLYMKDGVWNGKRILPQGWVAYTLSPANAAQDGGYGAQIWLNAGGPGKPDDLPVKGMPSSMYYLSGFEGQNVVVIPEYDLIVVRMGLTTQGTRPIWNLARAVLAATQPLSG